MSPIIAATPAAEAPPFVPMPLPADWVLEGTPTASGRVAVTGPAGNQHGGLWQCTAGRFKYVFDVHETVYILEGGVTITDEAGGQVTLGPGDFAHFTQGATTTWHVPAFVKKAFFLYKEA